LRPGETRILDRNWWVRLWIVLDHVESEDAVQLAQLEHALHCGALDYRAGTQAFDLHWEQALTLQGRIRRALFPWLPANDRQTAIQRMLAEYKRLHDGLDYDDPEMQQRIRATVAFLYQRAQEGRQQNMFGGKRA
jgi:hypothetical protein